MGLKRWRLALIPVLLLLTGLCLDRATAGISDSAARRGPFGHVDPVRPVTNAVAHAPQGETCRLCSDPPDYPIVQLTEAIVDSLGRVYSDFNQSLFAYVDSLYQEGHFGTPGKRDAKNTALMMSRLLALNSLHYMVGFATDPDTVYEATEATLRHAFTLYSDPGVYPIVRMVRARMGLGWICVQYDVSTDMDSIMTLGTERVRIRVGETEYDGETRRMLMMDLPTIMFSTIEVVLDSHFTCKAELFHSPGPPSPHDIYLLYQMRGLAVRKWGVHKPDAMIFWSTPRNVHRNLPPKSPLVGSAVYVPAVRMELPSILPDMKFNDLRLLDLPQPIMARAYIDSKGYPSWMDRAEPRGFKEWESYGPIPPDLQLRFPDK